VPGEDVDVNLQGTLNGRLYATSGRKLYREHRESTGGEVEFRPVGSLPVVGSGLSGVFERLQTGDPWKRAVEAVVGSYRTANVWPLSGTELLATTGTCAFVSGDGGRSWSRSLALPESSPPMGVLPSCVCVDGDATYLGEYPLSESARPRLLRSTDRGRTWETLLTLEDVRHFHSVAVDPYGGDLWATTGDRDGECRILRTSGGDLETVGRGSQAWRAVELAFTGDSVLWGVDCAYADANPVFELPRSALETGAPDPRQVGELDSSVYYAETLAVDGTEWVVLATAAETGVDRTAPAGRRGSDDRGATVVAGSDASGFTEWRRLARYPRKRTPADRTGDPPRIPSANGYVFLAADPERGVFVNPLNTVHDGEIRRIPRSAFRD
jgi:hypothetical protein